MFIYMYIWIYIYMYIYLYMYIYMFFHSHRGFLCRSLLKCMRSLLKNVRQSFSRQCVCNQFTAKKRCNTLQYTTSHHSTLQHIL